MKTMCLTTIGTISVNGVCATGVIEASYHNLVPYCCEGLWFLKPSNSWLS